MSTTATEGSEATNEDLDIDVISEENGLPEPLELLSPPKPLTFLSRVTTRLPGFCGTQLATHYLEQTLNRVCQGFTTPTAVTVTEMSAQVAHIQGACVKKVVQAVPYVGERVASKLLPTFRVEDLQLATVTTTTHSTIAQSAVMLGYGSVLVNTGAFLVRQAMNTVWLYWGKLNAETYTKKTVKNAAGAMAGVGGAAMGAAVGTLIKPGLGTGVGSFVGSLVASSMTEKRCRKVLKISDTSQESDPLFESEHAEVEINEIEDGWVMISPSEVATVPKDWVRITENPNEPVEKNQHENTSLSTIT